VFGEIPTVFVDSYCSGPAFVPALDLNVPFTHSLSGEYHVREMNDVGIDLCPGSFFIYQTCVPIGCAPGQLYFDPATLTHPVPPPSPWVGPLHLER
jgi:hypothetical protein